MIRIVLALCLLTFPAAAQPTAAFWGAWSAIPSPVSCPDNDGSGGASAGTPQFPSLASGYAAWINGNHGLGCQVAGVDYHVGLSSSQTLSDPAAGGLPTGASYNASTHVLTVSGNGVTLQGWDLSLHGGIGIQVSGSVTGLTITNNNFAVGANCVAPLIAFSPVQSMTISYNTENGGGATCSALSGGFAADWNFQALANGAVLTTKYNYINHVSEDAFDIAGPSSGSAQWINQYNLIYLQGWKGHPDGIQYCGGNFTTGDVHSHNTYYTVSGGGPTLAGGVQPFHVEAQCTASIANATVAYNTILTTGSCTGGSFPTGCSANYDIACKQDAGSNTNTGFKAYGNYIDKSGALAALTNAYSCTSTTWGSPYSNYDVVAGTTLPTNP